MSDFSELKNRIKYIRKISCRGSQKDLAQILGVNEARIKSLETGRVKDLTLDEATDLVKNFNVRLEWLQSGDGEKYDYGKLRLGEINQMADAGDDGAKQLSKSWAFMKSLPLVQIDWYGLTLRDVEEAAKNGNKQAMELMMDIDPMWGIPDYSLDDAAEAFEMQETLRQKGTPPIEDFIQVPVYDIQASAGPGVLVESEEQKAVINFSPYYLSSLGVPSSKAAIIYVKGDSMLGTLDPETPILIDTSVQTMQQDGIYVIRIGDTLHVKRIQRQLDGSLNIISDNPRYQPYTISGADLEQVQIVGRVVLSVQLF